MKELVRHDVLGLRAGELVEVLGEDEILATLDERGELDGLPFMPEMLQFCGRRFRVASRPSSSATPSTAAACTAWSTPSTSRACAATARPMAAARRPASSTGRRHGSGGSTPSRRRPTATAPPRRGPAIPACSLPLLAQATRKASDPETGEEVYACQATELLRAAPERIPPWDIGSTSQDVRSTNAGLLTVLRSVVVGAFNEYQDLSVKLLPRWLRIHGGKRFPFLDGTLRRTPTETLDLQPGELVRIKSKEEIVRTLDTGNRNRGMRFDAEMLRYCGRQARVVGRVERIIDEPSGRMLELKNPCIVLEDVICLGDYHRLCPRGTYPYWREIWLERV